MAWPRLTILLGLLAWLVPSAVFAQSPNDNCVNAIAVPFGANDFGLGVYTTPSSDLTGATIQFGEPFHSIQVSGGTDKKSVWYSFHLPTHRGVRVELKQPGNAIPQADVGFTVYYTNSCLPSLSDIIPAKLTPLNKFGNSFNPCLEPGDYLIQVSSKNNPNTNSSIFLDITTSYPGILNSYDLNTSPQNFGTVSGNGNWTDFDVGCLTIEDTTESCNALGANFREYVQSSWHTFTTDNFVDYIEFEVRQQNIITGNPWKMGYRLFQGDASAFPTPWQTLPLIDGCKVLTSGSPKVGYKCELLPNTTYSIQLFYHKDLESTTGVRITERGIGQTVAPDPTSIAPSHQLGALPGSAGGTWTYMNDVFACNARMVDNLCGSVVPNSYSYGGNTYNLNDWWTFTLSQTSNVRFTQSSGCLPIYARLYAGNVTGNCNLSLTQDWSGTYDLTCLPAGTYSLQILGIEGTSAPLTCNQSHLAQTISAGIRVTNVVQGNQFSLAVSGAVDTLINSGGMHLPLPDGVNVYSQTDQFGCANTVLPAGNVCGTNTKAIYRIIRINGRGTLTVGGGNTYFSYRLYQGNAHALANAQNKHNYGDLITGLTDMFGCQTLWTTAIVCVDTGIYTLVSFGDDADIARSDQPWVRFDRLDEKFDLSGQDSVEKINNLVPLLSGLTYNTTQDVFDCDGTPLPSGNVCGAAHNRGIYRIFTINKTGTIRVGNGNPNFRYSIYAGNANTLATAQNKHAEGDIFTGLSPLITCQTAWPTSFWNCITLGTYTLVTFGDDNDVAQTDQPWIRFTAYNSKYNLEATDSVNFVNNTLPLNPGTTYNSNTDLFDCRATVLPAGNVCGGSIDRAIYREFTVGVTGIITIGGGNWAAGVQYQLYAGDANALATGQSVFNYPQTISGLTSVIGCNSLYYPQSVCVTPGVYTLVSFGNGSMVGVSDQPYIRLDTVTTKFWDPLNPDSLGNVTSSGGTGTVDHFSCLDNPLTIDGKAPCNSGTKQIYRTFYLSAPRKVSISVSGAGQVRLFSGNSALGTGGLTAYSDGFYGDWGCFYSKTADDCYPLPAGWYTVVTYGNQSNLNQATNITISILPFPTPPKYNRPYKAYFAGTTNYCLACDVGAYPVTKAPYTFGTEYFNCIPDTPFSAHPINACDPTPATFNRVAYYVFTLTQESYIRLRNIPSNMRVQLYGLDVRTDSTLFPSTNPIQNCITRRSYNFDGCTTWYGEIEFCRLQPGTYTFAIFATDAHVGTTLTPEMWVEKVENSRFDHAQKAYDFGAVPGDNINHLGKVGDVNPLNAGRAASNDFFTCTVGAQPTDPGLTDAAYLCWKGIYKYPDSATVPYPMPNDYAVYEYHPTTEDTTYPPLRRNLWYTFVINGPGTVHVSVYNKTTGQTSQYPFTVYSSDVDANLPWSTIQATGEVDSTYADSLKYIRNNSQFYYYCGCTGSAQSISFTRDACDGKPTRYYVVVDHHALLELNNQVEVGIRYDSVPAISVLYDHFAHANQVNGLGQTAPPYTNVSLGDGIYAGAEGSYLCATRSGFETNPCGTNTLWYKVNLGVEGLLRLQFGTSNGDTTWNASNMLLYQETVSGDSTTIVPVSMYQITSGGRYWGETCIDPGIYYIQLTGCSYTQQQVTPYVWVIDKPVVYDHFAHHNVINGLNEKVGPYTQVDLISGVFTGDSATFACATKAPSDQNTCGTRTLWYGFDVGTSGKLRVNYSIVNSGTFFNTQNVMLFREIIAGDSTSLGLQQIPLTNVYLNSQNWGQSCFYAGRYYIMLTGCWYTTQDVYPRLWLEEDPGDYCTNAISVAMTNADTVNATGNIDCHTIGEAFGEDGSNMGCLFGPGGYKSTWFRVDLTTAQKVDLTFRMTENTTASASQIRYRILYGNCGAMTAGPCNTDALTEFTLNCMQSGSYYVQVITPENAEGSVTIEASTTITLDQNCTPLNPNQPVANFTFQTGCESDSVYFENQSTQGSNMVYTWDFGDGNSSNAVHPVHLYPTTGTVTGYSVSLIATDTSTGNADTILIVVTTFPQPSGYITRDMPYDGDTIPGMVPVNFHPNPSDTISSPPSTYFWDFGDGQTSADSAPDSIYFSSLGTHVITLTIMNGTCAFDTTDTIMVGLEPVFAGGPSDGGDMGEYSPCAQDTIFAGGPFDGGDMGEESPCAQDTLFVGGPYDGGDFGEFKDCNEDTVFTGGPYDGGARGDFSECDTPQVFVGGPFDGADATDEGIFIGIVAGGNDTICAGDSVSLYAGLFNGISASAILWSTGATTDTIKVAPAVSTLYQVTITPANGCGDLKADIFIFVIDQLPVADAGPDLTVCGPQGALIGVPAINGFTYSWTPATGLSNPALAQPVAAPLVTTTYTLTVSAGGSCPDSSDSMVFTVEPAASVVAGNDTVICPGDTAYLSASGADTYIWYEDTAVFVASGLSNGLPVPNFSASSGANPENAALSNFSGWIPTASSTAEYIQMDLGANYPIYQLQTRGSTFFNRWVTSYYFSYSLDGITWYFYKNGASVQLFGGNADNNTIVSQFLSGFVTARYVRFHPAGWASGGIGMRVDVVTAPQMTLGNPLQVTHPGNYIVHGHVDLCGEVGIDTVSVTTGTEVALHYRSRQNGDWTNLTTWQVFDSVSMMWVNAELYGTCLNVPYPTHRSLTIQVRDSVYYDYSIPIGIDECTIDPVSAHNPVYGGLIHIPLGNTFFLVDSSLSPYPADLQNNGRLQIEGNFTPVGTGLLVNSFASTVEYLRNGNQTMWNGKYGRLEASTGGLKNVGGNSTLVRNQVEFLGAHIQLTNQNITLDTNCTVQNASFASGYFITNAFGRLIKRRIGPANVTVFEMPIGPSVSSYNKAIITNIGTTDNFLIRVSPTFEFNPNFPNDELVDTSSVNRTWHLDEAVSGGSNFTLDLYWVSPHENFAFDRNACTVGRYLGSTGWNRLDPFTPAAGSGTVVDPWHQFSTGITGTGPFSVGSCKLDGLHYRTIANGNWTDINIWEVYDSVSMGWVAASFVNGNCGLVSYPTSASLTVQVRHNVLYDFTIPIGVDQVSISSTAHLRVPAGINLILVDGPGSDFPTMVNTMDLDNDGYFEITGDFTVMGPATLVNDPASIVHYNGGNQMMWSGFYGWLYVDGSLPNAGTVKSLGGSNTYVQTGLNFINSKINLANLNMEMGPNCAVLTPGQNTGYMIATNNGYCVWNYNAGLLQSHKFPLGGVYYSPATIIFDTVLAPGTMLGRVRETQHPTRYTIFRYWTMTEGTIDYQGEYDGVFQYDDADLPNPPVTPAIEFPQVEVGGVYNPAYTQPGGWRLSPLDISNNLDLPNNTGTIRNDTFSDFTFMPLNPPLELDLLVFDGNWDHEDAYLYWNSLKEHNHFGYILERSLDGFSFDSIAFYSAKGNYAAINAYHHYDEEVRTIHEETFHYRLRMIDLNGNFEYSNVVTLYRTLEANAEEFLTVFPNPAGQGQDFTLQYQLNEDLEVRITLFDVLGKFILQQEHSFVTGFNEVRIPAQALSAGAYYLKLDSRHGIINRKLLIIR
ncbi:MAG: discoidin domain-containing protein [Bacteroidia bacterium]|nr:discoidin domain-containing protein [Bacteroidia bacterium]